MRVELPESLIRLRGGAAAFCQACRNEVATAEASAARATMETAAEFEVVTTDIAVALLREGK